MRGSLVISAAIAATVLAQQGNDAPQQSPVPTPTPNATTDSPSVSFPPISKCVPVCFADAGNKTYTCVGTNAGLCVPNATQCRLDFPFAINSNQTFKPLMSVLDGEQTLPEVSSNNTFKIFDCQAQGRNNATQAPNQTTVAPEEIIPPTEPVPSGPAVSVNSTTPPLPSPAASSNKSAATFGVIGGVLAVALVSFAIIYQRRKSRQTPHKSLSEAVVDTTDPDGYLLAASPKNDVSIAIETNFFKYIQTVDAFKSLWLPLNGVRTLPVKGSHSLLQATANNTKHVLKGVDFTKVSDSTLFSYCRAIQLVVALPPHDNLTRITGVSLMEVSQKFAVATEYMNKGSLGAVLLDDLKSNSLTTTQMIDMCLQVASGLLHLHEINCVYGFLHPEKVLVHSNEDSLTCKLNILAMMDHVFVPNPQCSLRLGAMTLPYLAPELRDGGAATMSGDVYALGVLMAQIFVRNLPYQATYHEMGFVQGDVFLKTHPAHAPYTLPDTMPQFLQDIVLSCWNVSSSSRPTASIIVSTIRSNI